MSEIKALEKLRDLHGCIDIPMLKNRLCAETNTRNVISALEAIADEIDAEIEREWMRLPVDAEGEPWHIGDVTENGNMVNAITFDRFGAHFTGTVNDIDPSIHVHFKPRTLEGLLRDIQQDVLTSQGEYCGEVIDADEWQRQLEEQVGMYADEIRAMFGEVDHD